MWRSIPSMCAACWPRPQADMHNCGAKKMGGTRWPSSPSGRTFMEEDESCSLRTPPGCLSRKNQAEAAGQAEAEPVGPEGVVREAAEAREAPGEPAGPEAPAERGAKAAPEAPGELAEEPPGVPAAELLRIPTQTIRIRSTRSQGLSS